MEYIGNPTCRCDPDRCEYCEDWPFQWAADFSSAVFVDDECDYCDEAAEIYTLTNTGACSATYKESSVCTVTIGSAGDFDLALNVTLELIHFDLTSVYYRLTIWWGFEWTTNINQALAFVRYETSTWDTAAEASCWYISSVDKIELLLVAYDWASHGFGFQGFGDICSGIPPSVIEIWSADI